MKKLRRKTIAILSSILMVMGSAGVNYAEEETVEEASKDLILEKIESVGAKSVYEGDLSLPKEINSKNLKSQLETEDLSNLNIDNNDNVVVHNNGEPMHTDLFEEKQGNELFAVVMSNSDGVQNETYYISNTNALMNTTLNEMTDDISNAKSNRAASAKAIKSYKWDFYRNIVGGRIQTGSLYTEVDSTKAGNATVDGANSSIWDVLARSEVKSRSDERINSSFVRLDAGVGSQRLHDFAPETSSNSTLSVSLSKILNPKFWTITAGGYTTKSLSPGLSSRYGRWEFKARAGRQNSWVTRPGIRASNRSGNFVVKYSQTMQLNYSSHSTGVIQISMGDR
jgi:hypothetical protein